MFQLLFYPVVKFPGKPSVEMSHPVDDGRSLVTRIGGNPANSYYGAWPVYAASWALPQQLRVYSVGIGGDVTFDRAIAKLKDASVACFDPTIENSRFAQIGGAGDTR